MSGRVVLIAPERAARPVALRPGIALNSSDCPFCPGREYDTPHECYAVRDPASRPDGPGWQLRVVPNRFPFVRPLAAGDSEQPQSAVGIHEVVIETARHCDPVELTPGELTRVLIAIRDRLRVFGEFPWCQAVSAFRNVGAEAGASLAHPHSQLVALPRALPGLLREWEGAAAHHARTGECPFCAMLREPTRLVLCGDGFAAVCPFAPRFAHETWVMPTRHAGRFEAILESDAAGLAGVLLGLFARLRRVVPGAAFNLTLHTAPPRGLVSAGWHWHLKLLPRTAKPAGFEWATDCFVNPVPPEVAAEQLRTAG